MILYIATFYKAPSIYAKIHCPIAHVCNFTNLIPQILLYYFIFVKKIINRLINNSHLSGETSALRTATIFLMLHVKTVFRTKCMDRFEIFTVIKTQAEEIFHMGAILLFYILKIVLQKNVAFFPRFVAVHYFKITNLPTHKCLLLLLWILRN